MTKLRNIAAAALVTGLGIAMTGSAHAQAAGGGRGGNEGGGEGPFLAVPGGPNDLNRFDTGCHRPGDRVTIDWQGLSEFDGQIALVTDAGAAPLDVTSWTDRAVLARLPGAEAGRTFPVVWTDADGVQAKIGELRTCAGDRV